MTTPDESRVNMAAAQLTRRLEKFLGQNLTTGLMHDVKVLVRDHRRESKLRGIHFPELVALILPKAGVIKLVHKDLDEKGVQTTVLNMTVEFPHVTREELAQAVIWAFPWYRSTHFHANAPVKFHGINGEGANA